MPPGRFPCRASWASSSASALAAGKGGVKRCPRVSLGKSMAGRSRRKQKNSRRQRLGQILGRCHNPRSATAGGTSQGQRARFFFSWRFSGIQPAFQRSALGRRSAAAFAAQPGQRAWRGAAFLLLAVVRFAAGLAADGSLHLGVNAQRLADAQARVGLAVCSSWSIGGR